MLSESFIEKYKDRVDSVSYTHLFIEKHADKVD